MPVVAGEDRLLEVNGYVETSRYAGMTLGPLIGGVRPWEEPRWRCWSTPGPSPDRGRARDGVVFLFCDRMLAIVIGTVFVSLLFMSATITAEVFFLKQDLGVGDALYGVLFSAWTVGMVLGALVISRRVAAAGLAGGTLIAIAVQGAGIGLPAVWLAVGFVGAMWFVGGLGHGTKNVLARTLIQQRVPERVHGRAFAAYNGLRNGAELFALAAGGILVATLGARVTLAIAGGVSTFVALVALAVYRRRGEPEPVAEEDEARKPLDAELPATADPSVPIPP